MALSSRKQVSPYRWYGFLAGTVVLALVVGWMTWMRTPRLEASEEAIKTVDALFTAINSHDEKPVLACKDQLNKHTSNGKLSLQAMTELANRKSRTRMVRCKASAIRFFT